MQVVLLHHSLVGGTRDLASRFKYPFKNYLNYRGESDYIVLVGRHIYKDDDLFRMENFINYHKDKIIGVIVSDDKNFGYHFGDSIAFYEKLGVEILALWDRAVTDNQITKMEELIDDKVR